MFFSHAASYIMDMPGILVFTHFLFFSYFFLLKQYSLIDSPFESESFTDSESFVISIKKKKMIVLVNRVDKSPRLH